MPQKIETISPTLEPSRAIELLNKQLAKIDEIINLPHNDAKVRAWDNFTEQLLINAFGKPHGNLTDYHMTQHSGGPIRIGMPDYEWQENHVKSMENMRELLISFIDQLELLTPSISLPAEKVHGEPRRQVVQNFYITQSQAQQIENTINLDEQTSEVKEKVEELLAQLKKTDSKDKNKIGEIVKWLADRAIDVLIAILARSQC